MKTLKLVFVITLFSVFGREHLYCQTMYWDTTYTTTVLYDNFSTSQLDLNKWSVEDNSYTANGVIIDSSATVSVNSGDLKLSVISCIDCSRAGETRNLAGGEVITNESLQYGIIECSARIDLSEASMPIFSFIGGNGNDCANGNYYASEVDIFKVVEPPFGSTQLQRRIYHHHPDTDCKLDFTSVNLDWEGITSSLNDFFDYYHTYKCVWTPNYIRYYVDGDLKHEVTNTEAECPVCNQSWFPTYSSQVHLCNKVGGNMYYTNYTSTYYDWVRVKEFFPAPEINLPQAVCANSMHTATLDVVTEASNITWSLSPTNLFTTTSGYGDTANINTTYGAGGTGTITFSFEMPSGETFTKSETFWVGTPVITGLDGPTYVPTNVDTRYYPLYEYQYDSPTNFMWVVDPADDVSYNSYGWSTLVNFSNSGYYNIIYRGLNTCGWGDWYYSPSIQVYNSYYMMITPNPTSGEAIISIEKEGKEKTFDETAEWELEIYDDVQNLKEKKIKLREKSTTINTQNWKEGVYHILAKYKNEILTGKLIVKN